MGKLFTQVTADEWGVETGKRTITDLERIPRVEYEMNMEHYKSRNMPQHVTDYTTWYNIYASDHDDLMKWARRAKPGDERTYNHYVFICVG